MRTETTHVDYINNGTSARISISLIRLIFFGTRARNAHLCCGCGTWYSNVWDYLDVDILLRKLSVLKHMLINPIIIGYFVEHSSADELVLNCMSCAYKS